MKAKFLSTAKRKIGAITICTAMVLTLGTTSAFAANATQSAKMVKDGEISAGAVMVKDGADVGQQLNDSETPVKKAIGTPIKVKDGEIPAGAVMVKDGAGVGQQLNDGETPVKKAIGTPIKVENGEASIGAIRVKDGVTAGQQNNN